MIKENKGKAILSSLLILAPTVIGLFLWDQLPDQMIVHWGADGVADGFGPKAMTVFGLPCLMLILHWICLWITAKDPKNKENTPKALGLPFWILPAVSLTVCSTMYRIALGQEIDPEKLMPAALGILFLFFGNYLPKIKQNRTLGIKVIWALRNEENWNRTHRFGGKLWVGGGLLILCSLFFPESISMTVTLVTLLILCFAPMIYSYLIHRKGLNDPKYMAQQIPLPPSQKKLMHITTAILCVTMVFIGWIMFTGDITVSYGEEAFLIDASYWNDLEVNYDKIGEIEYRDSLEVGVRTNGWGSPRLSMGTFSNGEFGRYTLYAYTDCEAYVVLTQDEHVLVIGGKDAAATKEIYHALSEKLAQ